MIGLNLGKGVILAVHLIPSWSLYWILGYFISLFLGHWIVKWILEAIRKKTGCHKDGKNWKNLEKYEVKFSKAKDLTLKLSYEEPNLKDLSPGFQGVLERFVFTTAVAFNVTGTIIAMMAWLGVKMVTNLNRPDLPPKKIVRLRALTGLQGSLISMALALIGGLICQFNNPLLSG